MLEQSNLFGDPPKVVRPPPLDLAKELRQATETLAYWDIEVQILSEELWEPNSEFYGLLAALRQTHPQRRGWLPVPRKDKPDACKLVTSVDRLDRSPRAIARRKPLWAALDDNVFEFGKQREALREAKSAAKRAERQVKMLQKLWKKQQTKGA